MVNAFVRVGARTYPLYDLSISTVDQSIVSKLQSVSHDGVVIIKFTGCTAVPMRFLNKEAAMASLTPAPEHDDDYIVNNGAWIKTAEYLARMDACEKVFGSWEQDVNEYELSV